MRNYVTEEKAKTMWCPFSSVTNEEGGGFNRSTVLRNDRPRGTNCIGKDCMVFCDCGVSSAERYYCGLTRGN